MELVFTRWEEVVGAELSSHVQPMRLQNSTLVVGVDHPIWATRARMATERILRQLQQLGDSSIERIEVVVQTVVAVGRGRSKRAEMRQLSGRMERSDGNAGDHGSGIRSAPRKIAVLKGRACGDKG